MKSVAFDENLKASELTASSSVACLKEALADTYVLYVKTQNFHWNVTGPSFYALHLLTEEQYKEMAEAVDEIAERIRALGDFAPGSLTAFKTLSRIEEQAEDFTGYELLSILVEDHTKMASAYHKVLEDPRFDIDAGTVDLFTRRLLAHEKHAWMLKSHVG